jgi:hypothetical protein
MVQYNGFVDRVFLMLSIFNEGLISAVLYLEIERKE